jgi:hypothetical protein
MLDWFKKKPSAPNGPDFSSVDSQAKAEARVQAGEMERLLLLPTEFGGTEDSRNVVYVPRGFVAIKAGIDTNIIKPLVASGRITQYRAVPEYEGRSFVPIAIQIVASNPGSLTTDINIWGKALARKS